MHGAFHIFITAWHVFGVRRQTAIFHANWWPGGHQFSSLVEQVSVLPKAEMQQPGYAWSDLWVRVWKKPQKTQKRSSDDKTCSFSVHKQIPFCNWFCGTDCQQLVVEHSCRERGVQIFHWPVVATWLQTSLCTSVTAITRRFLVQHPLCDSTEQPTTHFSPTVWGKPEIPEELKVPRGSVASDSAFSSFMETKQNYSDDTD